MSPSNDIMADGISIRVRVRRAPSAAKLEYGETQEMVCTIVNWDNTNAVRQQQRRKGRHNTSSSASSIRGPTLFFNTRTHAGHTLEACCSLQSVSSYDSSIMEPSVSGEEGNEHNATTTATTKEEAKKDAHIHTTTTTTPIAEMMQAQQQLHRIKKSFSVPCSCIKTVEKMSYLLFRGYRICFITGSRGAFELEFENKNGRDIMMAFLQATLPGERFVHCGSGSTAERSVDGSDTASYLSALDLEKLTERLAAERQYNETMSEKLRNGVGKVVSRMEEMSSSICGNMCCSGMHSSSVAPCEPATAPLFASNHNNSNHNKPPSFLGHVMEIDENDDDESQDNKDSFDVDALRKRRYLKEYSLPSGLSVELPPEPTTKYRLASV